MAAPPPAHQSPLTVQPPSSTTTTSALSRILLPVNVIRTLKLQTGDPVAVYPASKPANSLATPFTVGTVWPSFALDPTHVQLPSLLLASTSSSPTSSSSSFSPISPSTRFQPGDQVLLHPIATTSSSASTRPPPVAASLKLSLQQKAKLSPSHRQLLSVFSKEALVDLECLHLGQSLSLAFQGHHYLLRVSSFKDANGRQGLPLSLPSGQTTSVCLVSRQTDVGIVQVSESTPGTAAAAAAAEETEKVRQDAAKQRIQAAYSSLGGLDKQIQEIRALVEMPLTRPEIFRQYGLRPPKGVLLFGPPGTGKTSLAKAVAASTGSSYLTINGPELSSAFHGETEGKLREAFREARRKSPCVVIIDEIDALAPRREGGSGDGGNADGAGEVERRVVAQLLTLLDGMDDDDDSEGDGVEDGDDGVGEERPMGAAVKKGPPRVVVLAATNRPNAIDPALRRPGRLDREIEIGIPTAEARRSIVETLLRTVPHSLKAAQIDELAARTHGYVGADLSALVREAGMRAVRRAFDRQAQRESRDSLEGRMESMALDTRPSEAAKEEEEEEGDTLVYADFIAALPLVRPSAMREIFLEPPKVFWSDIAGADLDAASSSSLGTETSTKSVQTQVRELVEWPLKHKAVFQRLGVRAPRGVLLYGPPGCSKTLIARALATESGLNFIAVKGPELYSKYVGESERAVRQVFKKARSAAPSIIFFDEIDALTTTRSSNSESNGPSDRVIASLLNEMDGIEGLENVIIVAATNRPEIIDPALLRPGRLDRLLYVGPPNFATRRQILASQTAKMAVQAAELDLDKLANMTSGCSGAEVVSLCQEAGWLAMNEDLLTPTISQHHFEAAAAAIKRRITPAMIRGYEAWRDGLTL